MKKIFLIPLLTLFSCVMAWAGNQPAKAIEPVPFQFNEAAPAAKAAAPARMKAEAAEQDILLEYEGFSQHFTSLQAAFNALPPNSTPAKVTLYSDVDVDYEGKCLSVAAYQRVTLELNGHGIYGTTEQAIASVVIENRGNLTIDDAVGTGIITNLSSNPDVSWSAEDAAHPYPTYANNVINNRGNGVLTINGGLIKNETGGAAAFPIDMYENSTLIINGGHIYNFYCPAIRFFGSSNAAHSQNVTINGGLVEGYCPIWMQAPSVNKAPYMNLKIAGGEIRTTAKCYAQGTCGIFDAPDALYCDGNGTCDNTTVTIIGGIVNANIEIYQNGRLSISGGRINGYLYVDEGGCSIDGGVFDFNGCSAEDLEAAYNYDKDFIASGYVFKYIGTTPENENEDPIYEVVPANQQEVTESKTMEQIAEEIETAGEDVPASIIEINAAATEEKAVVTVNSDIAVEGIVIKNDNNKEGQIVVESGVTLTVGNSGIVSENNDLTTVVVKPGGTIIIGNGGVDQQGNAIPVEIQNDGDKSGVFLIDPNAPATVAEAPAKVKVYTRAHKDNGIEYWQQLASPVKGSTITVTPLGTLQGNHDFLTSVYEWDYATDSWARITDGMDVISEGVYAFRGDAGWTTSDAVLKPFAALDLINNSHASHGGVTYEFAGKLVGNDDMVLNFPENGFCTFGNSYTAPIDLSTLFAKITNDMAQANIDPCVYMYNSSADRFESVNSLGLWLKELGIMDVAFSQIPPQQAFVMNLLSGNSAQSAVDYATCVWGNPNTNKNTPILAPSRQQAASFSALLNIEVTDGEATDRVVLIEDEKYSEAYDNGADAEKYMNNTFNIYANAERNLAMVATDNIENTELSFKAGKAVNYTMTFGKTMGDFVLVDRANNSQIAIVEGGIYTFAAQPNATAEARFAVVPAPKMPTAIENTGVKTNVKGIYTIMGQYLGENFDILPAGVYVIDGVKIVK